MMTSSMRSYMTSSMRSYMTSSLYEPIKMRVDDHFLHVLEFRGFKKNY